MSHCSSDPAELDADLSDDLRGRVKSELEPGERLLWVSRAQFVAPIGCLVSGVGVGVVLAAVAIALFLVEVRSRASDGSPFVFGIVAGILTLLTFLATLSNWNQRRKQAARIAGTLYALTDRRAIIWVPEWSRKGAIRVHSVGRGEVATVFRIECADGSGDVVFRLRSIEILDGFSAEPPGFRGIPDVRRVEELVRRTLLVTRESS